MFYLKGYWSGQLHRTND